MALKSKLPHVGTTVFTVMSQLAQQNNALNLGQGFPSFEPDNRLLNLACKALKEGKNQYTPMKGLQTLREAVVRDFKSKYKAEFDSEDEITITCGGSQALFTAISTLIFPGDEVILFAPAYDCYSPAVELNGGVVKWITLDYPDYSIPWEKVRQAITVKTRCIIINSPNNPTGKVWSRLDILELIKIVQEYNIYLISDEVYESIVFDGMQHNSLAQFPEIRDKLILIYSFGKNLHITGWKIGYLLCSAAIMKEFRKQHQFNVFTCNSIGQHAIAEFYNLYPGQNNNSSLFQSKRDTLLVGLKDSKFKFNPSQGTYFQLIEYTGDAVGSDLDLAKKWTEENKVTFIPTSVFYPEWYRSSKKIFRVCFAKTESELEKSVDLINSIQ
jgi:methionine aminotransferase